MTIEEFGQRIKTKYPEYEDLENKDLGSKILKKYPEYQDLITDNPQQEIQAQQSILQKTTGIFDAVFGGGRIGEAIGTSLAKTGLTGLRPEERQFVSPAPRPSQIAGDVAQIGLTLGTLGGVGTVGKLGVRALKTAGVGAGLTTAGALRRGEEVTPKTIAGGAAFGAGLTLGGAAIGSIAKGITQFLPTRLIRSATGQSKKALLAGKDVSEFVLKKRRVGTANSLIKTSQSQIETLSSQIQKNLENAPRTARLLKNQIISDVTRRINQEGGQISSKDIAIVLERLAPQAKGLLAKKSMSLTEANRLRQSIDKTLGDRGFLISELPFNKEVLRSFSNSLRERVKTLAPQGTRMFFSELSKEIRLRDALTEKYSREAGNQILNAFDIITAGFGGAIGGFPGAVTAATTKKVLQSPAFKTGAAITLNELNRLQPIFQKLAPAERTLMLNVFNKIIRPDNLQEMPQ